MYYPSSQIKRNLYTNGGDLVLINTRESYIGYYYEVSNGEKFTENGLNTRLIQLESLDAIPPTNPSPSLSIIEPYLAGGKDGFPIKAEFDVNIYYNIQSPPQPLKRFIPPPNQPQPSSKDYESGRFIRYFAKKNNELKYMEINKETHDQLNSKQPDIAWDLYTPTIIIWTLTGEQEKVFSTNKKIVALSEKQNKWYGFSQWFKDNFLKYYLEPK